MINKKSAFTLAEILIVISILGIVAAITISSVITHSRDRVIVTSALKTYAALNNAVEMWMIEENCVGDISICIADMRNRGIRSPHGFDGIARHLNVVESTHYINGNNEQGENISQIEVNRANWLPDRAKLYNGRDQQYAWQAVSKYGGGTNGGNNNSTGLYLLKDGVTLSFQFPDDHGISGFGFFDANGKSGPNKVGVDIYPFGLGIPYNTPEQKANNERLYGAKAKGLNPYFVEDDGWSGEGMCAVRNGAFCSDDNRNNPTAWLLIHKRVPNR